MTTVLVVEDNPSQRKLLSKLLQRMELNVIFAGNGVEALELVQSHCPNLVILDMLCPG